MSVFKSTTLLFNEGRKMDWSKYQLHKLSLVKKKEKNVGLIYVIVFHKNKPKLYLLDI